MKASDLRVGNLVLSGNCHIIVYNIHKDVINYGHSQGGDDGDLIELLTGIPLTEECLLNTGFKHDGFYNNVKRWIKGEILLFQGNGHFILCHYPLTKIKYLHQLQNICLDLTGNELEIK